jgi:hypothetical protein
MSFRRDLARVMSWALLAYSALSLSIALWLLIARWPIVASNGSTWRALAWLCAANLALSALLMAALAGAGRDAIHTPPAESRKSWFARDLAD